VNLLIFAKFGGASVAPPTNTKLFMEDLNSMGTQKVVTAAFRLAFPQVFTPKAAQEGGRAKYSLVMLFPSDGSVLYPVSPKGAGIMELRKLAFEACRDAYGPDRAKWPAALRAIDFKTAFSPTGKDGFPIRNGDDTTTQGYKGMTYIRCSSYQQPTVVDSKVHAVLDQSKVFGGLICRAQVNAYCFDQNGNKGVTFGLDNLQIIHDDGTTFSGKDRAEDVFSAFGDPDSDAQAPASAPADEPW
jgi:hypothetical protein